jgi:hypothetical protein
MAYKCYLPCRGEFGWMITTFVLKFHGDPSPNKIICCKPSQDCFYPTATHFFYDWQDIPDDQKMGIISMSDEEDIKEKILFSLVHQKLIGIIVLIFINTLLFHNLRNYLI